MLLAAAAGFLYQPWEMSSETLLAQSFLFLPSCSCLHGSPQLLVWESSKTTPSWRGMDPLSVFFLVSLFSGSSRTKYFLQMFEYTKERKTGRQPGLSFLASHLWVPNSSHEAELVPRVGSQSSLFLNMSSSTSMQDRYEPYDSVVIKVVHKAWRNCLSAMEYVVCVHLWNCGST